MKEENIRSIIVSLKEYIPNESIPLLIERLKKVDDNSFEYILSMKMHNPTTVLLLSIFLGGLGVDRFIIGDIGLGVAKLLLGWLTFGIWPFIDIFFSYKRAKEINYNNIMSELYHY